jgi:hypothetical protein
MGYKGVMLLMAAGYILHFTPHRTGLAVQRIVTRSPLLIQALLLAVLIFIIVQVKSAGVQPFIYFRF